MEIDEKGIVYYDLEDIIKPINDQNNKICNNKNKNKNKKSLRGAKNGRRR